MLDANYYSIDTITPEVTRNIRPAAILKSFAQTYTEFMDASSYDDLVLMLHGAEPPAIAARS
jgi:hypothetical protein